MFHSLYTRFSLARQTLKNTWILERLPANTQESRNFVIACNRYSYSLKWDRPFISEFITGRSICFVFLWNASIMSFCSIFMCKANKPQHQINSLQHQQDCDMPQNNNLNGTDGRIVVHLVWVSGVSCPSCLTHLKSICWAIWVRWAAIKKDRLTKPITIQRAASSLYLVLWALFLYCWPYCPSCHTYWIALVGQHGQSQQ